MPTCHDKRSATAAVTLLSREHTNCARGVSALLILVFHLLIAWDCPRIVNLPGSVSVAAFLILSGYGINESFKKSGLKGYWRKKLSRIVLPFWLFVLVLLPFREDYGCRELLLEMAFIDSSFWFVPYLMWCYVLYWVLQRFFSRHFVVLFALVAVVAMNLLYQMAAEQSFSFFAGVVISRHIDWLRHLSKRSLLTIAVVAFLLGFAFLLLKEIPAVHAYKGTIPYNYVLLPIKLSLGLVLTLVPVLLPFLVRSRLLYWCGISSLEVYLVHMAVVNSVAMTWQSVLLFVLFTVVCTYIYYQINHKVIARIV